MLASVFGLVGVLVFVLGANTVIFFATGTRLAFSAPTRPGDASSLSCQDLEPRSDQPTSAPAERDSVSDRESE